MKPVSARLPGQRDQPLEPDALLDLGALGAGALVVPEDRRPEHRSFGVEHDEPVHLAGEADPGAARGRRREHGLRRVPPVLRVLLGPAGLRRRERVPSLGARKHVALRARSRRLDAGRADVEAD